MSTMHLTISADLLGVVQMAFYQLRQIRTVISSLAPAVEETIVHTFINSLLEYCNTLFQRISAAQISRLRSVQNAPAVITGSLDPGTTNTSVLSFTDSGL